MLTGVGVAPRLMTGAAMAIGRGRAKVVCVLPVDTAGAAIVVAEVMTFGEEVAPVLSSGSFIAVVVPTDVGVGVPPTNVVG